MTTQTELKEHLVQDVQRCVFDMPVDANAREGLTDEEVSDTVESMGEVLNRWSEEGTPYLVVDFNRYDSTKSGRMFTHASSFKEAYNLYLLDVNGERLPKDEREAIVNGKEFTQVDEEFACYEYEESDILIHKLPA